MSPVCGSRTEREKAGVDASGPLTWAGSSHRVGDRERAEAATEGTEYRGGTRRRTSS